MARWMRIVAACGIVLAGCGRVNFGDRTDAVAIDARACASPVGHDEDHDGFDDACDVCPQLADDQSDTDGDGVGDACDLAATQETRTFFDPFTVMRAEWSYDNDSVFRGDSVTMVSLGTGASVFFLTGTPGRTVLEMGGVVDAIGTTGPQIAIHIGQNASSTNYYCELYRSTGPLELKLTHYNGAYSTLGSIPIGGGFASGVAWRLLFEHTPPQLRCIAWWNGMRYEATGTDPNDFPPEEIHIATNDIDIELQYFIRLTTP